MTGRQRAASTILRQAGAGRAANPYRFNPPRAA